MYGHHNLLCIHDCSNVCGFTLICIYNDHVWHLDMYFGMCVKLLLAMLRMSIYDFLCVW